MTKTTGLLLRGSHKCFKFLTNLGEAMLAYFKWLFNFTCKHELKRCIHGDEIILSGFNRSACLTCPKLFKELPVLCSSTNKPH